MLLLKAIYRVIYPFFCCKTLLKHNAKNLHNCYINFIENTPYLSGIHIILETEDDDIQIAKFEVDVI